jgi:hypothetical protein
LLLTRGPGVLSVDHLIALRFSPAADAPHAPVARTPCRHSEA